jgi:hypothetical protein
VNYFDGEHRAIFFLAVPSATKVLYDLMQGAHDKALSCSVIAKVKKGSDVKWRQLNARIEDAGEVGAPRHLKIKAYHMDVEGGAESAGFPMEDLADILMQRRWYLTSIAESTHRGPDQRPMFSRSSPRRPHSTVIL